MTNKEFTGLLKRAEKVIFWNDGYMVTLGFAIKNGINDPSVECYRILKEINDEIYYRISNDILLTATQEEILNRKRFI